MTRLDPETVLAWPERKSTEALPAFRWTESRGVEELPVAPWTGPLPEDLTAEALSALPWR
jgi:hypothetical protein